MKEKIALIAFFIGPLALGQVARATTWDSKIAGEYYNEAEIVARVTIMEATAIEGELLPNGTRAICSVRYVAKPVDVLKGKVDSSVVFYGGNVKTLFQDYLVFLSTDPKENAMASTNSVSMAARQEWENACRNAKPKGLQSNDFAESTLYSAWNPVTKKSEDWAEPGLITFPLGDFPERHEMQVGVIQFDGKAPPQSVRGFMPYEKFPLPFSVWKFGGAVKWDEYREYILGSAKMDGRYKYPQPDMEPNLVDRDPETGKVVPKAKPFRGVQETP